MIKQCIKCGEEKELDLFAKGKNYNDGRRNICKKCHSNYVNNYYKLNPDKYDEKRKLNIGKKSDANWKRHRITENKYNELLSLFNGKCHACQERVATNIDHDHSCCDMPRSCGKCVRGILCNQCNTALGLMQDDIVKLNKLIHYIGL
jgi:hypothetical protein